MTCARIDGVKLLRGERPIHDVNVVPLRRIPDERGTILHMLKSTDPHFKGFGEIYFSTAYPGVVKGWHEHREMTLSYACVFGRIKLALFDDRPNSPTNGALMEIYLGPDCYALTQIPPGVWSGWKALSDPFAMVANCCTHAHDPSLSSRLDPFDNQIPYHWDLKHE